MKQYYSEMTLVQMLADADNYIEFLETEVDKLNRELSNNEDEIHILGNIIDYETKSEEPTLWDKFNKKFTELEEHKLKEPILWDEFQMPTQMNVIHTKPTTTWQCSLGKKTGKLLSKDIDLSKKGKQKRENRKLPEDTNNIGLDKGQKIGQTGKNNKNKGNFYMAKDKYGKPVMNEDGSVRRFKDVYECLEFTQSLGYKSGYSAVSGNISWSVSNGVKKYGYYWYVIS